MEVLFAGVRVARLDRAVDWYARFFARPPDIVPNEREAMWQVAGAGWLYLLEDPQRAGQALVTIAVSDLDVVVEDLAARGVATDPIETVGEGARKARSRDPDGNDVDLIQVGPGQPNAVASR